jgi:chromosome partitioning protein
MRTIAVVNQKGGCGKTITAINLSAFLAQAGRRVLLVDLDPQAHATLGLTTGEVTPGRTMYDVFRTRTGGPEIGLPEIVRNVGENLDLAPTDILLSTIPESLAGLPGRENVLTWAFASIDERYDYVIVDCPPSVGLLTFNAFKACSEAIIPMDPSFFSLHGIGKLFETFELLEKATDHRIAGRVLVTLYSGRSPFVRAVLEDVHRNLPGRVFETVVRYSVKLAEAASHGLPITRYARESAGYADYQKLANEVLALEPQARAEAPPAQPPSAEAPPAETPPANEPATLEPIAVPPVLAAGPPVSTPEGILFTVEAPNAFEVQIAGDFNDWTPEHTLMEPKGRVWRRVLQLAPGRYRYRFVIDGKWLPDPLNPLFEPSQFAGDDSVVVVGEPEPAEPVTARGQDGAS